ncbi:MAG: glyoxylate/hydroxypyruvate reductase A [Acidiferrobacterales bacterium]|nr:glyoxylate/hydroxypyruvate reductase A [Acidiferrobacterales bacterium]
MQNNTDSSRPLIAVKSDFDRFVEWQQAFKERDIDIVDWRQRHQHLERLRYALVWQPEAGALADMPALEVIFSIGAGVDHLKGENIVPEGVPVVRMVQDSLTAGMVEYVVFQVLGFHRNMHRYIHDQRAKRWSPIPYPMPAERTVGILGLGVLGSAAAKALKQFGFHLAGWSRSPKSVPGVKSFHGDAQLPDFLAATNYLVCLLPNTPQTEGLINRDTLSALPSGAFIINAGRGSAVVDDDLIAAIRSGHIAGAALDVVNDEPLDDKSEYWEMENVIITPHIASMTHPSDSADHVAQNIRRHLDGLSLTHLADLDRGY